MGSKIDSIYVLLKKLAEHLKDSTDEHYWIYAGYKQFGSLLIKDLGDERKMLFKPWDTENSIGRTKIKEFVDRNITFHLWGQANNLVW